MLLYAFIYSSLQDGMDFYFTDKQKAVRFIDFLSHHVPQKSKYSRKLVSADHKSNVGDFKHNFIVMLAPLCKDDLVIIPRQLANNLSDISQVGALTLLLVTFSNFYLLDLLGSFASSRASAQASMSSIRARARSRS